MGSTMSGIGAGVLSMFSDYDYYYKENNFRFKLFIFKLVIHMVALFINYLIKVHRF